MSRLSVGIVVTVLSLSFCAPQELDLFAIREPITSNIIHLQCINVEDDATLSDALFFLNSTNLEELDPTALRNDNGVVMLITRALEGTYSCALPFDHRTSDKKILIGECAVSK